MESFPTFHTPHFRCELCRGERGQVEEGERLSKPSHSTLQCKCLSATGCCPYPHPALHLPYPPSPPPSLQHPTLFNPLNPSPSPAPRPSPYPPLPHQDGLSHFVLPGVGYLGYSQLPYFPRTAVVLSDPVAPKGQWGVLTNAFLNKHPRAMFVQVSEAYAQLLR